MDHESLVLRKLQDFDWGKLKQRLELTHIYLLGLWDVGDEIVVNSESGVDLLIKENRCPSAFAIVDHQKVWPKLGNEKDLRDLVTKIHQVGMKVVVDFVANHTGLNHPWLSQHPGWYKSGVAFSGDVRELDYSVSEVNLAMIKVATQMISYGIDGFRCDMAHLVPTSFWKELVTRVKLEKSDFKFIAESYDQSVFDHDNEQALLAAGFDGIYDSGLYSNLRFVAGGADFSYVDNYMEFASQTNNSHLVHYLSNHDDPFPLDESIFWSLLHRIKALPGWLLLYNGSDSGFLKRLAHHYVEILPDKYVNGSSQTGEL